MPSTPGLYEVWSVARVIPAYVPHVGAEGFDRRHRGPDVRSRSRVGGSFASTRLEADGHGQQDRHDHEHDDELDQREAVFPAHAPPIGGGHPSLE